MAKPWPVGTVQTNSPMRLTRDQARPPSAVAPGRYLVTLELKRGAWPEPGKIWIGPRFVEAPEEGKLVADRSRYMVDKKHWEEHAPRTHQTFVVRPAR